jgi:hypothetical protein
VKSKNKVAFLVAFLLLVVQHGYSQYGESKIPWHENRKLTWSDFKKKSDSKRGHAAKSFVLILKKIEFNHDTIRMYPAAGFFIKHSWVIESGQTKELLEHEQLHFDITELYARKFRKLLLEANYKPKRASVHRVYNKLNRKIYTELFARQQQYDEETEHSLNQEKQDEWNRKITEELKQLESFANPVVSVIPNY